MLRRRRRRGLTRRHDRAGETHSKQRGLGNQRHAHPGLVARIAREQPGCEADGAHERRDRCDESSRARALLQRDEERGRHCSHDSAAHREHQRACGREPIETERDVWMRREDAPQEDRVEHCAAQRADRLHTDGDERQPLKQRAHVHAASDWRPVPRGGPERSTPGGAGCRSQCARLRANFRSPCAKSSRPNESSTAVCSEVHTAQRPGQTSRLSPSGQGWRSS